LSQFLGYHASEAYFDAIFKSDPQSINPMKDYVNMNNCTPGIYGDNYLHSSGQD
jgi:hypothetical protein